MVGLGLVGMGWSVVVGGGEVGRGGVVGWVVVGCGW